MHALATGQVKAILFIILNMASGTGIVFANKIVMSFYDFHFVYALTFIHTVVTMVGMWTFASIGLYERKSLTARQILPLAAASVGYIVFWNMSLQLNSVGFYQLSKILIAPAIIMFEAMWFQKVPTRLELAAVAALCVGVTLATVTDETVVSNLAGILVSGLAVWTTSIYQIWAGSKQREFQVSSMQLMDNYCPYAAGLLLFLVPAFEPLGIPTPLTVPLSKPLPDSLLGFEYTPKIVCAIALTAVLGLLVSLSTFLVIGATSSLTFNVMGHLKTVIILAGGFVLFQEPMPPKKLAGVCLALAGICWYSWLKMNPAAGQSGSPNPSPNKGRHDMESPGKGHQAKEALKEPLLSSPAKLRAFAP